MRLTRRLGHTPRWLELYDCRHLSFEWVCDSSAEIAGVRTRGEAEISGIDNRHWLAARERLSRGQKV